MLTAIALQLVFVAGERGGDDVAMVHLRAEPADGLDPEPMDTLDVSGCEIGGVRAKRELASAGVGRPHDEPRPDRPIFRRPVPGRTQLMSLIGCGHLPGLADDDLGDL